jgi:ABC-type lipoprotein export system ATPase subunit
MVALEVDRLTMEFTSGGYKVRPLNELSFTADDGQLVVLLGPSGCGKTTLLSCLAGLLTPTSGSIRIDGKEVTSLRGSALSGYRRDSVGVVFQVADAVVELVPHRAEADRVPVAVELAAGEVLFRQGDPSDVVYVVESGEVELYRELADGGEEQLAIIRGGGYFGELGPMMNLPRSASARALTSASLTSYSLQLFRSRTPGGSPAVSQPVG